MNGIVEVILSLSDYSSPEIPILCPMVGCGKDNDKSLNCFNCPLSSTRFIEPNIKLFYGDSNE